MKLTLAVHKTGQLSATFCAVATQTPKPPMNLASSAHCCHRGAEQIVSIKTAKSNFSSKKHGPDIKAFLCRKLTEKTDDFAIIPAYCGFGTFV
jgi:hypothetical protein